MPDRDHVRVRDLQVGEGVLPEREQSRHPGILETERSRPAQAQIEELPRSSPRRRERRPAPIDSVQERNVLPVRTKCLEKGIVELDDVVVLEEPARVDAHVGGHQSVAQIDAERLEPARHHARPGAVHTGDDDNPSRSARCRRAGNTDRQARLGVTHRNARSPMQAPAI